MHSDENLERIPGPNLDFDQLPDNQPDRSVERAASDVCYHQNCPVCGRNLRIGVKLLGRRVYCQHCGGGFIASDTVSAADLRRPTNRPQAAIVDELIERAAVMLARSSD